MYLTRSTMLMLALCGAAGVTLVLAAIDEAIPPVKQNFITRTRSSADQPDHFNDRL